MARNLSNSRNRADHRRRLAVLAQSLDTFQQSDGVGRPDQLPTVPVALAAADFRPNH
ncbi:hypothetical protein D3C71_1519460 [compost metagenome]